MIRNFITRLLAIGLVLILIPQITPPAYGFIENKTLATNSDNVTQGDANIEVIESTNQNLILELLLPEYQLIQTATNLGECTQVHITGWNTIGQTGEPVLPMTGVLIGIPVGGNPELTQVETVEQQVIRQFKLCPASTRLEEAMPTGEVRDAGESLIVDQQAYNTNQEYPSSLAALGPTSFIRSQSVKQLRLQPFHYNPVTKTLTIVKRLRVKVEFGISKAAESMTSVDEGVYEQVLQQSLINYDASQSWRLKPSDQQALTSSRLFTLPAYKLAVSQDGIVRVTFNALVDAGVPISEIDPQTFRLTNHGNEVALIVQGDSLIFYGQKTDTRFTDTNIYWLTWGGVNGLRMATSSGTPYDGSIPVSFRTVVHHEENKYYSSLYDSGSEKDHWFWELILATSPTSPPTSTYKEYTIDSSHISTTSTTARVRGLLKGYAANPHHYTNIYINNNFITAGSWPSNGEFSFDVEIPRTFLVDGSNTIKVEFPMTDGENPITVDYVYVNWFEVEYSKEYISDGGQTSFYGDQNGTLKYQVMNVNSNDKFVFDITDPLHPVQVIGSIFEPTGGTFNLQFQQTINARRRYIAASPVEMFTPSSIIQAQANDLRNAANGADYLIISHNNFLSAIQPLVDFRTAKGMMVKVVDVQDIYDEFSYGVFDPQAIRDFIEYAYQNWTLKKPTYVLLVGDGNFDFKNYYGRNQPNFVPVYLTNVDPWLGEIAADNRYVDISGDDLLPDLAIGRLPVMTAAETTNIVNKIIAYEGNATGAWAGKTLLVAGKNDPSSGNFPASSDIISNSLLSNGLLVDKVYYQTTYPDASATRQAIIAAFNEGRGIIHYAGHSTVLAWYGDPDNPNDSMMLNVSSVPSLENSGKLPIVISMTCLVGNFNNPFIRPLDETLLVTQDTGSVASFSPVGKGLPIGHDLLDLGLFDALLVKKITDLGSATNLAKYYLYANSTSNWDLLDTFTLLGDPALRFPTKPTAVDLKYFRAQKAPGGVQLIWETVTETTLAGFHLYRRELDGNFVRVNPSIIPSQASGQPEGRAYIYIDTTANLGTVYEYKLDVVENSLQVSTSLLTTYLPYSVSIPFLQR